MIKSWILEAQKFKQFSSAVIPSTGREFPEDELRTVFKLLTEDEKRDISAAASSERVITLLNNKSAAEYCLRLVEKSLKHLQSEGESH